MDGLATNDSAVCSTSLLTSWSWWLLAQTAVLGWVDMMVVLGNALVVAAVVTDRTLHTTTNMLITSLAVSDLLIGLLILPFSISHLSLGHVWAFGPVICEVWLAADVWLCTASIYNLVVVSFDRYMAVTQPLKYRLISSPRLGPIMVLVAWIVSFLICLPQVVITVLVHGAGSGANTRSFPNTTPSMGHPTIAAEVPSYDNASVPDCQCSPTNNDSAYVIYSSFGSFFVPLLLIIGLNCGIFRVARNVGKVVVVQDNGRRANGGPQPTPSTVTAMRVNVGGRAASIRRSPRADDQFLRRNSVPTNVLRGGESGLLVAGQLLTSGRSLLTTLAIPFDGKSCVSSRTSLLAEPVTPHYMTDMRKSAVQFHCHQPTIISQATVPSPPRISSQRVAGHLKGPRNRQQPMTPKPSSVSLRYASTTTRVRAETQVAKTIGVVVGCFTVCWLPFSVVYLLQAYDLCAVGTCVSADIFNAVFWLGYCNSALNPVIYALFSRDFRRAFRRVLVRLVRRNAGSTNERSGRTGRACGKGRPVDDGRTNPGTMHAGEVAL